MKRLGFDNVRNENQDFYKLIDADNLPEHDILMTNPPYSDDHIDRLLRFLSTHDKPFCLLMPNWVARKRNFKELLTRSVFYLSPFTPYTYTMPPWNERPDHVGTDGATTPYLSSWYISFRNNQEEQEKLMEQLNKVRQNDWVVAKTIKGVKWKIQKLAKKQSK